MLAGKLALVTGATSGIGLATARIFIQEGARVCLTGRNQETLENLSAELDMPHIVGDLTEEGACERIVNEAASQLGGLTTLVNCAGVLKGGAFGSANVDLDNFLFNFRANTQAVFECMHHAVPHLRSVDKGLNPSIINVSSVNGKQSFGGCASYCASKAAVDQLSRCAAIDLAPDGIRVNCVNPGVVLTELQKRGGLSEEQYAGFLERSKITHPLGRVGNPEEVGNLIAFLASDKASFMTGECIAIDGGRQCLGAR